jgi:hypothetical protein
MYGLITIRYVKWCSHAIIQVCTNIYSYRCFDLIWCNVLWVEWSKRYRQNHQSSIIKPSQTSENSLDFELRFCCSFLKNVWFHRFVTGFRLLEFKYCPSMTLSHAYVLLLGTLVMSSRFSQWMVCAVLLYRLKTILVNNMSMIDLMIWWIVTMIYLYCISDAFYVYALCDLTSTDLEGWWQTFTKTKQQHQLQTKKDTLVLWTYSQHFDISLGNSKILPALCIFTDLFASASNSSTVRMQVWKY